MNLINKVFQKNWLRILVTLLLLFPILGKSQINELKFEQLNWLGPGPILPNSSWFQVMISYTAHNSLQFFNLNVNGNWVIKNMGVDSLFEEDIQQEVATFFNLGVEHGTRVTELEFISSLTLEPLLSMPTGDFTHTEVYELDYMIGGLIGEEGITDNPINTDSIVSNIRSNHDDSKPEKSVKLPGISNANKLKSILQKQKLNECLPGAVSNSLKYLQATGKLDKTIDTSMDTIKKIVSWKESGTKGGWIDDKRKEFIKHNITTFEYKFNNIDQVIENIKKGCDVEVIFPGVNNQLGHAAWVVGIRKYSDKVEIDVFDDNQEDDQVDTVKRTVTLRKGSSEYGSEGDNKENKVKKFEEAKFVAECKLPEKKGCCKKPRRIKNFSFSEDQLPVCYQYKYSENECILQGGFFEEGECSECELLTELSNFSVMSQQEKILINWKSGSETNNAGFHIWRGIKNNAGNYEITSLKEFGHSEPVNPEPNENCSTKIQGQLKAANSHQDSKLISAIGNSAESTCYSFTDTSNLSDGTYYYLLEDIDNNGDSTFHCDQIDAVTVDRSSAIDLPSAINYCKEVTGSED